MVANNWQCTACDGVVVDINHAHVTGWAGLLVQQRGVAIPVAERQVEKPMKLGREVPTY